MKDQVKQLIEKYSGEIMLLQRKIDQNLEERERPIHLNIKYQFTRNINDLENRIQTRLQFITDLKSLGE